MAGPAWLVDPDRIATKIRSASGNPGSVVFRSNPTKACPNCHHIIDNSDVTQDWPGLPRGVKFDPSDQEIIWHLLAKVGVANLNPHPFINEFIPTVDKDGGICYTHPQFLPGVKQDGGVSHFFHKAIKAYNTGTRKRRKIHGENFGDLRWHKTGRTKPVFLDGLQRGMKKIMVLYLSPPKGGKTEKTNWVMHQYHLGKEEDEREGEYVISKVFYQLQQVKLAELNDQECLEGIDTTAKVDPVTPMSATPEHPRPERRLSDLDAGKEPATPWVDPITQGIIEDEVEAGLDNFDHQDLIPDNEADTGCQDLIPENQADLGCEDIVPENEADQVAGKNNEGGEDPKWWDSESQYLLDSQQLVEGLSLCDELLQSQSPARDGNENSKDVKCKPRLSDYAHLGPEDLKKDLEDCQNLVLDPSNIYVDTPPEFRPSQLEFGSQDSYIAWGGSKVTFDTGGKEFGSQDSYIAWEGSKVTFDTGGKVAD